MKPRFRCHPCMFRHFDSHRLPDPHLTHQVRLFPRRSPQRSSANAAVGGLEPPPAGRLRRAYLHLPRSTASRSSAYHQPPSAFVTHHFAYLRSWWCPVTCAPSPCGRPSRPPWQVVTPATTTGTVSPWGSRPVGDPTFVSAIRVERDVGAPLISFNALAGHRSDPRRLAASTAYTLPQGRRRFQASFRRASFCAFWRLGFSQSRFRHITRAPQPPAPYAWARAAGFLACCCPLTPFGSG